jgi:lysophospholipase L1-like esterase
MSQRIVHTQAGGTPRRSYRHLRWLVGACIAATLIVLACELILRHVWGLGNPPLLQADAEIGYLFQANQDLSRFGNQVHINQFYQRSPDITPLPAAGVHRILVLGDSVTWGGVVVTQSETFPSILESNLREAGGRYEVLNASAGSWAVGNELAYLQRFGTFGSDLVIWEIGSNDLLQEKSTSVSVGVHPSMPNRKPSTAIGELINRYGVPYLETMMSHDESPAPPDARTNMQNEQKVFLTNMSELDRGIDLARSSATQVLVIHVPELDEVVPGPDGSVVTRMENWRDLLRQHCAQRGIPIIDLSLEWREAPNVRQFFRDNVHPNQAGNHAIADRLTEWVRTHALNEHPLHG